VPVHCSASGKVFLAQMTPAQRRRLLAHAPLERCTPNTLTEPVELERELRRVARDGFAVDDEEFLPGLVCLAVAVPASGRASSLCVALQAPVMRLSTTKAKALRPLLQRAAEALGEIDAESDAAGLAQA
jgi:IclR family acetate operon transcriptional repressor